MSKENSVEPKGSMGFFQKLLSFFAGSDPDSEKKRKLKEIAKELKKQRFNFYKVKGGQVQPLFAKFFYEIYKNISPSQVFLENAQSSAVLKLLVIDSFLPQKVLELRERFDEEYIKERSQQVEPKTLATELKDNLVSYYAAFTGDIVSEIEKIYNLVIAFTDFTGFDYFFMLKKFDSGMPERDFVYIPRFEAINGEYVVEDLKDFLDLLSGISISAPWDKLFDILKNYKNTEVIDRAAWKKILKNIAAVTKEKTLLLMIRHIDSNPDYVPRVYSSGERIVEDHLTKIKSQAEITLQKIMKEKRTKKIDALLMKVFGTTAVSRMKNYTEKANIPFSKKMLGGFIYVAPANYLKAFLLDYYKRDIKNLVDILLIQGKWATQVASQQLSESFHAVMDISAELIAFDDDLSEEGTRGQSMKAMLTKPDRDKNNLVVLRRFLKEVNDSVLGMITETAQNLIIMGRSLKTILEDSSKKKGMEMIINWKELEAATDKDLREEILSVYKKIYYFVQLLQFFVKKK